MLPLAGAAKNIQLIPIPLTSTQIDNLTLAEQLLLDAENYLDGSVLENTIVVDPNDTNTSLQYDYMDYVESDFGMYYKVGGGKDIGLTDPTQGVPTPLTGNIYIQQDNHTNMTDYYVLLDDEPSNQNVDVNLVFSSIEQDPVIFDVPVTLRQSIRLENKENVSLLYTVNLGDYVDEIPKDYLEDVTGLEIFFNGSLISELPIFEVNLPAKETKTVFITYRYSPITKELFCEDQAIQDLLPADATVIQSDLPLETIVAKKCSVKLNYDSIVKYVSIGLSLGDMASGDLQSVYSIQDDAFLPVENNTVYIDFE